MILVQTICQYLESLAPVQLAAAWDNVGLLAGDRRSEVQRVMTCLSVTAATVAEAVNEQANLIVTHHPLPFRPLKQLTRDTPEGRYLLDLLTAGIAIYSPHTAFDSAASGINQKIAKGIGLVEIEPLVADPVDPTIGEGRSGRVAAGCTVMELAERVKGFLKIPHLRMVGEAGKKIEHVAVACGSAGTFLEASRTKGCQLLLTGETTFHTCLAAEAEEMVLFLAGHFASEQFAMQGLAEDLAAEFKGLRVWASQNERDPLQLL